MCIWKSTTFSCCQIISLIESNIYVFAISHNMMWLKLTLTSSAKMHPVAQTSTFGPYWRSPTRSSGARYHFVATYSVRVSPGAKANIKIKFCFLFCSGRLQKKYQKITKYTFIGDLCTKIKAKHLVCNNQ